MKRKPSPRKARASKDEETIPIKTARSIFLQGDIDEELARSLTLQILRLREESSHPITVLIDSPGGSPLHATRILELLRAVDGGGNRPDIITVATGEASSAAADFLAQGDYVMAYRNASLLFHGTRTSSAEPVTRARAEWLETALEWHDTSAARRLAVSVFDRFVRLYAQFADETAAAREKSAIFIGTFDDLVGKGIFDIPALVSVLHEKIESEDAASLLEGALEETRRIRSILQLFNEFVEHKIDSAILGLVASRNKGARKKARMQLRVLEAAVASRLIGEEELDLNRKSFQELEADFRQVSVLAEGFFQDDLLDILLKYDDLFYGAKDSARVAKLRTLTMEEFDENPAAQKQLDSAVGRAYHKAEPLWQYVSTLCRLLNAKENEIEPVDAWHLGLIDEVIGYPLSHRMRKPQEIESIMHSLSIADTQKFMS